MKVGNKVGQNIANVETGKTGRSESGKKSDGGRVSPFSAGDLAGTARVNVSDRAQSMQKAKEIASQDTVDEAKVARLQKMIDEGRYKVDAKAVADRLVDEHLMMNDEV